jgi:hypothetical protein
MITYFRNPGPFGNTNRPGYPLPMELFGKFVSTACARSNLDSMHDPLKAHPDDIYTLNVLSDIIVDHIFLEV